LLTVLNFEVTISSSNRFLDRYVKLSKSDDLIHNLSRYIIELTLLEVALYKW